MREEWRDTVEEIFVCFACLGLGIILGYLTAPTPLTEAEISIIRRDAIREGAKQAYLNCGRKMIEIK